MKRYLTGLLLFLCVFTGCGQVTETSETSGTSASTEDETSDENTSSEDVSSDAAEEETEEMESSSEEEEEDEQVSLTITIPDGSRLNEIFEIITAAAEEAGISVTEEALKTEAENLTAALPEEAADCFYPLEGYLISGTYQITADENLMSSLLDASLEQIQLLIGNADDISIHEILTRASIVVTEGSCGGESEAHPEVFAQIAAVIDNRLTSGMKLQMNVTMWYASYLTETCGADEDVETAYNTYETDALPLGPIASPSADAIEAVLDPADTDDFFFVYDESGNYYFAETYEDHLKNCELLGLY